MSVPVSMCKLAATWRPPWYAQELLIFVIFIYFIVKLLTRMFLRWPLRWPIYPVVLTWSPLDTAPFPTHHETMSNFSLAFNSITSITWACIIVFKSEIYAGHSIVVIKAFLRNFVQQERLAEQYFRPFWAFKIGGYRRTNSVRVLKPTRTSENHLRTLQILLLCLLWIR